MTRPPGDAEDRRRVERCLTGDPGAWDEFTGAFAPMLERKAARELTRAGIPGPETTAPEIIQEVFAALLRDRWALLRNFRWECPLDQYLLAVVQRRCVDWIRRQRSDWPLKRDDFRARLWQDLAREEPLAPDHAVQDEEARDRLRAALDRLPDRERLVIFLFYWDERPTAAIARLLKLRPGTIGSLLSRARGHLRSFLEDRAGR